MKIALKYIVVLVLLLSVLVTVIDAFLKYKIPDYVVASCYFLIALSFGYFAYLSYKKKE